MTNLRTGRGAARTGLLGLALGFAPWGLSAQERPIVMIDAGHGGDEIGVALEGLGEKDVVLQIAFVVAAEFVEAGYDVRLTRTGDYAVAWEDRRAAAEQAGAALLFMLHANGDEDASAHGAEVYAFPEAPTSQAAATHVARALRGAGLRVVEEPRDWPFLRSPSVATVMIELAYLTNPSERRLLLSEEFQHELGEKLVSAADAWVEASRP